MFETQREEPVERIEAVVLREAISRLMHAEGLQVEHAVDVASCLVETSLMGIDTHGVRLIPTYLKELSGGRANPRPNFRVESRLPAIALFDADHALGVVAASAAMREAMERARLNGVAAIAVANSNHLGAAGYFARMAAGSDQLGLVFSNSDALVAPMGSRVPLNGTNPIAMAAPACGEDGFHLDLATSQVSYSRVLRALNENQPLPPGWATDARGRDAAEPDYIRPPENGFATLQPLGGYKGQGLGTMVQILCALLADMPFDAQLTNLYAPPYDVPRKISHFIVAIEISGFTAPDRFRARLSELLGMFRSSTTHDGKPVSVAGDYERHLRNERLRLGIPLEKEVMNYLSPFLNDGPRGAREV